MTELQVFNNEKFGNLEIYVDENGKVWFPATDVAKMLGYKNPRDAISKHCKKSGKLPVSRITTEGNGYEKTYIDEGNVIRLITKSHISGAEELESWVFDDIVPSVMKNGFYSVEHQLPQTHIEAVEAYLVELKKNEQLVIEKEKLTDKVALDKPKVEFYDDVMRSDTALTMDKVAKILNFKSVGRNKLFDILRKEKMLQGNNAPYQAYVDRGWFDSKENRYTKPDGDICVTLTTVVYQKGAEAISKLLTKLGYVKQHLNETCTSIAVN